MVRLRGGAFVVAYEAAKKAAAYDDDSSDDEDSGVEELAGLIEHDLCEMPPRDDCSREDEFVEPSVNATEAETEVTVAECSESIGLRSSGLVHEKTISDPQREDEFVEPSVNATEAETEVTVSECSESIGLRSSSLEHEKTIGDHRRKRKNKEKQAAARDAWDIANKGDFTKRFRGDNKKENGQDSLVSGKKNTCLPDAFFNAASALINF